MKSVRNISQVTTGPLLILISTAFYASHGVWSKWLLPYFSVLDSSWTRSLIVILILLPILLWRRQFLIPKKADRKWLAAILIPGAVVTPLYFYAFEHLSVGVATLTFFMCYMLGAMLYGCLLFGEKLTIVKVVALTLGMIGLICVTLADVASYAGGVAIIASALAGFCGAAEITFTKKLPSGYSPYFVTFLIFLLTFFVTISLSFIYSPSFMTELPSLPLPWLLSVGYAISIIVGIVCVIRGFKTTAPGVGGIIGLMEVVFGLVFGIVLFGEQITFAIAAGTLLILVAALLPFFRYNRLHDTNTSSE